MLDKTEVPQVLQRLPQPPGQLYVAGDNFLQLLERPRLAIVGSRKITPYGRGVTQQLTRELVQAGVVIISGLAIGADSVAHAACLDAGGQTIAVLPAGLDNIYPRTHTNLARQIIVGGGALVTEYGPGSTPYKDHFLARNRLVAGLADAVLIPEAAVRSGSSNTVAHALDLNIPVLAIPGNITSPMSEGTNNLIKAGATPVTSVQDIYHALGWQPASAQDYKIIAHTPEEKLLLQLIQTGTSDGSQLLQTSGLEVALFHRTLTMLELTGRVRATGANHWALA